MTNQVVNKIVWYSLLICGFLLPFQNCSPIHEFSQNLSSSLGTCQIANTGPINSFKNNLPRLSNWEYKQILQDLAPEVFTAGWDPGLPELPSVNGFDNRVPLALDATTLETYMNKAEEWAQRLMSSPSVMNACNQSLIFADRGWDNCAYPIVAAMGEKLYRRPLRAEETTALRLKFNTFWASAESLINGSGPLTSGFDGVTSAGQRVVASGWSYDSQWIDRHVEVHFYARPLGSTANLTYIGKTLANLSRPDLGVAGNHGYEFPIPANLLNGSTFEISAYPIGGSNGASPGSPKTVTGTTQTAVSEYNGMYTTPFREGLTAVFMAMLSSPHFLFKPEFLHGGFLDNELNYERASRLSFLTRASFPDPALQNMARHAPLTGQTLRNEAARQLEVYGSRFATNFAGQWLSFRGDLNHSEALKSSMATESMYVFWHNMSNGGDARELLNPGYSFMNGLLATNYGMPSPGNDFVKVSTSERGGILQQGHFLSSTSGAVSTNPIKRGVWAMGKLLCRSLPALQAATVEEISEAKQHIDQNLPIDQRMALHRNSSTRCYTCHSQIDPMGLPLEKYDQLGKVRPDWLAKPVEIVGSETVTDPKSLANILAHGDEYNACVSRKLSAYISGVDSVVQYKSPNCKLGTSSGSNANIKDRTVELLVEEVQ